MTANFDAAKSAALAISMLDWRDHGKSYGRKMITVARALATALTDQGIAVFTPPAGATSSHQFAIQAAAFNGGQRASTALRKTGFLASSIGLPLPEIAGDMNGLRIGTPELVRWGVEEHHCPKLAGLIASGLNSDHPETLATEVAEWRRSFDQLKYIHNS